MVVGDAGDAGGVGGIYVCLRTDYPCYRENGAKAKPRVGLLQQKALLRENTPGVFYFALT